MERLPWDMIIIILCRLDVKSILLFKCLSKSFRSFVDSQEFIKIYLKSSIETDSKHSLLFFGTDAPILSPQYYCSGRIFSARLDSLDIAVELDHPFRHWKGDVTIIDSCNGLVALRNSRTALIALWNPSTKKHIILPEFWSDFDYQDIFVDGFGYDAATDDYKVVRIIEFVRTNETEFSVYSLKTNTRIRIRFINFPYYFTESYDGTFVDGHVHWLAAKTPDFDVEDVIIAFDLKSGKFHQVQLPLIENIDSAGHRQVGNFRGCLFFSCVFGHPGPIDIWVKKGLSWNKLFSFPRRVYGNCDYAKALAYSKSGDKVLVDRLICEDDDDLHIHDWELHWHDLQTNIVAGEVRIQGAPQGNRHTVICVDSLVSLASYTEGRE